MVPAVEEGLGGAENPTDAGMDVEAEGAVLEEDAGGREGCVLGGKSLGISFNNFAIVSRLSSRDWLIAALKTAVAEPLEKSKG